MNPNEPDPADQPPPAVAPEADAPKPRRRRTPKPAPDAEPPGSPEAAADPQAGDAVPVAPARKRTRRKAAVDVNDQPDGHATDAAPSGTPGQEAEPASRVAAEPTAGLEPATGVPAPSGDDGGDGPSDAPGRKRRRNRRRGRRGARDEGAARDATAVEGSEPADAAADEGGDAGEAVALPPTDVNELFAELVSGSYDASVDGDAPAEPVPAGAGPSPRRVLAPDPDAPKLHKVLAQAGVGSRRDLEQMITEGRVAVNGQPAHVGQRISFGDRISIDGKPVKFRIAPPPPRVIAYHKPVGEVVTHDDPQHRPTVFRRLPRLAQGKWQSVGRLDINTEGLLLFTNSGDLANRLMHPRFGVEREYAVRVLGTLSDDERSRLLEGVEIEGQPAAFKSITDGGGEGVNHWYRVVITEGRNREVRKLMESVGKAVSRLIRIRYGSVVLPRGLKRGVWVDLPVDDVKALRHATGMAGPRREGEGKGPPDERRGKRGKRGRGGQRPDADRPLATGGRPAVPDFDGDDEVENIGPIPNPLQQTYDKRAIQQARRQTREYGDDGPIPNPLQQTYDKRALQGERKPRRDDDDEGGPIPNPLQQTYDRRFAQGPGPKGGAGRGGGGGRPRQKGGAAGRSAGGAGPKAAGGQPDPMRTSVGYIGADAFHNKSRTGRGKGGGRGGKGGPRR